MDQVLSKRPDFIPRNQAFQNRSKTMNSFIKVLTIDI